ncbi:hypothetical protein [Desulfogranum japonicum]|uniref:hypothetical protein n=1 Tax=Desulfogranum japonicum TaxID=231447 RepID=UPI0004087E02|nr:hypothetical protein [Desulfogranum japonicum]
MAASFATVVTFEEYNRSALHPTPAGWLTAASGQPSPFRQQNLSTDSIYMEQRAGSV